MGINAKRLPVQNDPPLPDIDPIRLTYRAYCSLCSFCSLFKSEPLPRLATSRRDNLRLPRYCLESHSVTLSESERDRGGGEKEERRHCWNRFEIAGFTFNRFLDHLLNASRNWTDESQSDNFPVSLGATCVHCSTVHTTITIKITVADKAVALWKLLAEER